MWILKLVAVLVILAGVGLIAYAYLGDMGADPQETRTPVLLEGLGE